MANRRANYRMVKIHRNYTVEEAACLFGIHKNTVREWVRAGLPAFDEKRPMLILGSDLADFLKTRRSKNKRPCHHGEMYCVRCRAPKLPAGGMADCLPLTPSVGRLTAICPDCFTMLNQCVSMAKLDLLRTKLEITFPQALDQVSNTTQPSVNSDLV